MQSDDITDPAAWRSINSITTKLLDPPADAWYPRHDMKDLVKIKLSWAVKTIGEAHFHMSHPTGRPVLREESKLKIYGCHAGLPRGFHRWLCGGEEQRKNVAWASEAYWITEEQFRQVGFSTLKLRQD
ncbi:hypothetical protein K505DRAFT_245166 [Melanomma pulvis-pyrius CBS 109.77]|uniref:Uncharacterized protein n=1 Tax=Melanomma pulvis-pyrius CBS 109.77 TaxID=1314802 RepID=A0A6A6XBN1_9PLEO|nr:hypothetical protein K505DRAFT_245166 [Melanomma pulvis-pyrius CBS 109.77]